MPLGRFLAQVHYNWAGQRPIGSCGLLGLFGLHRGGAESAMAELAQAAAACSRRRCRLVGAAPRPEPGGGGRGEALSGSPGGRTSLEKGPPRRREFGRWEERRWRGLGVGVVGFGARKQRPVARVPWAVTARLVHSRGGRSTMEGRGRGAQRTAMAAGGKKEKGWGSA
jgi:hypothetical protein